MKIDFDKDILDEIEKKEKERGKPFGQLERLEMATELQKQRYSAKACEEAKDMLIDLQNRVRDLKAIKVSVSSLKGEYAKLGTALGIKAGGKQTAEPTVEKKLRPTTDERKAAILQAFTDGSIEPLKSGHFPQAAVSKQAAKILYDAGTRWSKGQSEPILPAPSVQAAYKALCQQSEPMTEEDKQATGNPTGKPVKVKLLKAVTDNLDAEKKWAYEVISSLINRVKDITEDETADE